MKHLPYHASTLKHRSTARFPIGTCTLHFISHLLAIICMLSVISGCTTTIRTKFTPLQIPNVKPSFDLAIALNITEDFREYVWHDIDPLKLQPVAMPLDGIMADNAEVVARAVFRNVTVEEEGISSSNRSPGKQQAVLTPRVVQIGLFPPIWQVEVWENIEQTVSMEWTLRTLDGAIIWVGTSTGRFTLPGGTAYSFKGNMRQRLRKAIDNAFTNSIEIMVESQEIAAYIKKL